MNILSIDLATKETGIAVMDLDKIIHYDCIVCKDKYLENRLIYMKHQILKLTDTYKVDVIISEQEQVHISSLTTIGLAKMQGVLRCLSDDSNIPYLFVPINVWRESAGIKTHGVKREELKLLAIQKVKELFNIETCDDNIAEAILIGEYFRKNNRKFGGL
jgi:Holliday junction resolvasome RuvABC endonuclease subunit